MDGTPSNGTFLSETTVETFTTEANHTISSRALGWNTNDPFAKDEGWDLSCGQLSPRTFMHLGYTGRRQTLTRAQHTHKRVRCAAFSLCAHGCASAPRLRLFLTAPSLSLPGTMVCGDPMNEVYLVLLTNRVYPTDTGTGIHEVRQNFSNAVAKALGIV